MATYSSGLPIAFLSFYFWRIRNCLTRIISDIYRLISFLVELSQWSLLHSINHLPLRKAFALSSHSASDDRFCPQNSGQSSAKCSPAKTDQKSFLCSLDLGLNWDNSGRWDWSAGSFKLKVSTTWAMWGKWLWKEWNSLPSVKTSYARRVQIHEDELR